MMFPDMSSERVTLRFTPNLLSPGSLAALMCTLLALATAALIRLSSRAEPGGGPAGSGAREEADVLADGRELETPPGLPAPQPATSVPPSTAAGPGSQRMISTLPPRTSKPNQ